MRTLLLSLGLGLVLAGTAAQGEGVRLAIVPADAALAAAADVLTVDLSRQTNVALLERAQIEKVYREQAVQAGQRGDFLRLGQALGADGVLILELERQGDRQQLAVRLVAVKPGVVLQQRNHPWPLSDLPEWSALVARQFQTMLPKLGVLPKDAVPLSILNLRAAVRSAEAERLEHELTLVLHDRLTLERDLFVLERRGLATLAEEKDLKQATNSAFWNGSYLIEGTIDPEGFSQHQVTIHARLVPPGGQAAMEIRTVGLRTNLASVADSLTRKILASLQRTNAAPAWKPADEAAQYFAEGKWASKWGLLPEAQAAADSAWALGKRDMDCAWLRVKSYVRAAASDTGQYHQGESRNGTGNAKFTRYAIHELTNDHPWGLAIVQRGLDLNYVFVGNYPDPKSIDRAFHVLALYHEFSQTLPPDQPAPDSSWYQLGIEVLGAASRVLQHFHFVPQAVPNAADKLAELRSLTRAVAKRITDSVPVRDVYWIGDRWLSPDEIPQPQETLAIYQLQLAWGCFWQETPEAGVALYRELMSSPMFAYLDGPLRFRPLEQPLLAGWNPPDRTRRKDVWNRFEQEMENSTNVMSRLEARCLKIAALQKWEDLEAQFDSLMELIVSFHDVIVTNNVDLLHSRWNLRDLISGLGGSLQNPTKEKLQQRFNTEFSVKLDALSREHHAYGERVALLEKQRRYLEEQKPFNLFEFTKLFRQQEYTKAEAAELLPKITAYKSNAVGTGSAQLMASVHLTRLEKNVAQILHPAPPATNTTAARAPLRPPPGPQTPPLPGTKALTADVLIVSRYLEFPLEGPSRDETLLCFTCASRWRNGRLWLGWHVFRVARDAGIPIRHFHALSAWDPRTATWEVIWHPDVSQEPYYGSHPGGLLFELTGDALFLDKSNALHKYDLAGKRWEKLNVPALRLTQLAAVNDRLFAANDESIFEILEGGQGTRLMASCRRRPPVTALDVMEKLWMVRFSSGPNQSLRATTGGFTWEWDGKDWKRTSLPFSDLEVFDGMDLLWSRTGAATELWLLPRGARAPELALREKWEHPLPSFSPGPRGASPEPTPTWSSSRRITDMPKRSTISGSNILFFVEHCGVTNLNNAWALTEKDGRHADLVCLDRRLSSPLTIPLRFDLTCGTYTAREIERRRGYPRSTTPWIQSTPEFLIVGQDGIPGFWVIPCKEIDARLDQAVGKSP